MYTNTNLKPLSMSLLDKIKIFDSEKASHSALSFNKRFLETNPDNATTA